MRYNSFASIAVIKTDSRDPVYFLEEKDPGYLHVKLRGSVLLVGGNRSGDSNFKDLMERELGEEFRRTPRLAEEIISRLRFYRGFETSTPRSHLTGVEEDYFRVKVAVFESILPGSLLGDFSMKKGEIIGYEEGRIKIYGEADLGKLEFGWGQDIIMKRYLDDIGRNLKLKPKLNGTVVNESGIDPERLFD